MFCRVREILIGGEQSQKVICATVRPCSHMTHPNRVFPSSSRTRRCSRRAMNSRSANVTAAFFVRSPLTSSALSRRSGSIERFVAMCCSLHTSLHTFEKKPPAHAGVMPRERCLIPKVAGGDTAIRENMKNASFRDCNGGFALHYYN